MGIVAIHNYCKVIYSGQWVNGFFRRDCLGGRCVGVELRVL